MSYRDFCLARSIDPYHPYATWTTEDHAAWYAAKLATFRAQWSYLKASGTTQLMTRDKIRSWVREGLDHLRAPVQSRPWRSCPCHSRPRQVAEDRKPMSHGISYIASCRPDPTKMAKLEGKA